MNDVKAIVDAVLRLLGHELPEGMSLLITQVPNETGLQVLGLRIDRLTRNMERLGQRAYIEEGSPYRGALRSLPELEIHATITDTFD